jgi:ABC-type molybdate transport system ATPase subunit
MLKQNGVKMLSENEQIQLQLKINNAISELNDINIKIARIMEYIDNDNITIQIDEAMNNIDNAISELSAVEL